MESGTKAGLVGVAYAGLSVAWFGRGLQQEDAGPAILTGPPLALAWRFEMIAVYLSGTLLLVALVMAGRAAPQWRPVLIPVGIFVWLLCGFLGSAPSI